MSAEKYYRTPSSIFGLSDDLKKAKQKKRIKGKGGDYPYRLVVCFGLHNLIISVLV